MRPDIEKPKTQNLRLDQTGLAKHCKTCGLTVIGPGLVHQNSACRVFGWFWNQTALFLRSKPRMLLGYLDLLLTLYLFHSAHNFQQAQSFTL